MMVALSNYCLEKNSISDGRWRATVTYGTGRDYKLQRLDKNIQDRIKGFIKSNFDNGVQFIEEVDNEFFEKIPSAIDLQDIFESNKTQDKTHPNQLLNTTEELISKYAGGEIVDSKNIFKYKSKVLQKQLYALYTIGRISKSIEEKDKQ